MKAEDKRGISPIVASVLLIVLVIIIGVIIFLWATNFLSDTEEKFGESARNICGEISLSVSYSGGSLNIVNRADRVPIYGVNVKDSDGDINERIFSEPLGPGKSTLISVSDADAVIPIIWVTDEGSQKSYVCDKNEYSV